MKVCQIDPCFPYEEHLIGNKIEKGYHIGGVEKHVLEISKILQDRGHEVTIVSTKSPLHDKYHEIKGLNVVRVNYGIPIFSSSIPLQILKKLKVSDFDIIHAHYANPMLVDLSCIINRNRTPFILTYHNDMVKYGLMGSLMSTTYNHTLGSYLLKNSDIIITTTKSYAQKSPYLEKVSDKIRVVPNCVDTGRFRCSGDTTIKARHEIPARSKIVLFAGAIEEYKGVLNLVRAFKKLHDADGDTYLIMVGHGSLVDRLKSLSEELSISDNVIFPGYVKESELPLYFSSCDLFVLPSIYGNEGFGIVQLEAMACCKPVIASSLPGVSEVDEEEVASEHVPPNNVDRLSDAMIHILGNWHVATNKGKNGRKLVEEKYSIKAIGDKIIDVYNEALSRRN